MSILGRIRTMIAAYPIRFVTIVHCNLSFDKQGCVRPSVKLVHCKFNFEKQDRIYGTYGGHCSW